MTDTASILRKAVKDSALMASQRDTDLLHQYCGQHDEAAFAELVHRHGPHVLRVCRHVLGEANADDAFQAVFLLLAQSEKRFMEPGSLAGWLHAVAVRIAHRARKSESRRRKRESVLRRPMAIQDDLSWSEVRELLDKAIAALPDQYRLPLVLCYFQELTQTEAARRIGCSTGALRGLLERGRQKLRKRLARFGIPVGALILVLGETPRVSAALMENVIGSAKSWRLGGVLPSSVAELLRSSRHLLVPRFLAPLAIVCIAMGAVLASLGRHDEKQMPDERTPTRNAIPTAAGIKPLNDAFGDALPPGALARLGSVRFYHGDGGTAHVNNLDHIIIAPDDKLVASCSYKEGRCDYKLWDGETGQSIPLWTGLTKLVPPVTFLLTRACGQLVAIVLDEKGSHFLDPVTGETIPSLKPIDGALKPNNGHTTSTEIAPDGKSVIGISLELTQLNTTLSCWNADTNSWGDLDIVPGQFKPRSFQFSANSKRVVASTIAGELFIWDLPSRKRILQLSDTGQNLDQALALSPDGKLVAWEDKGVKKVRILDVEIRKELPDLSDVDQSNRAGPGRKPGQMSLSFSPDGKTLAGIEMPTTIRLWDLSTGKKVRDIRAYSTQVRQIAFSSNGKRLYAVDGNGISVWDPATGKPLNDMGTHRYVIDSAAWSPDGKQVASGAGNTDDIARVWDSVTGRKLFDLTGHKSGIEAVIYSPDGTLLATGSRDGTTRLWDSATGKELHAFEVRNAANAKDSVYALAFSPDGSFLITGGFSLQVWDVPGRKRLRAIPHTGSLLLQVSFLGNGKQLLTRDTDLNTRIIDFQSGTEITRFAENAKGSQRVGLSHNERLLARAFEDGTIRLCNASTGAEVRILTFPVTKNTAAPFATGLSFSPDDRTVAAAYRTGEVRVYEIASGSERFCFAGHIDNPIGALFSPQGDRLCSFGADRTLLIWDVTGTRLPSAPPPKNPDTAWEELASRDAAKGFAAIRYLVSDPVATFSLASERVKPVPSADQKVVEDLIKKLGNDDFQEREQASKELATLAASALDQLRNAARETESPETRTRIIAILAKIDTKLSGELLRSVRMVEILERIAKPEARKLLSELAAGATGAVLTREASDALKRLDLKK